MVIIHSVKTMHGDASPAIREFLNLNRKVMTGEGMNDRGFSWVSTLRVAPETSFSPSRHCSLFYKIEK